MESFYEHRFSSIATDSLFYRATIQPPISPDQRDVMMPPPRFAQSEMPFINGPKVELLPTSDRNSFFHVLWDPNESAKKAKYI